MPAKDLLEKLFDAEREAEGIVAEAKAEAGRRSDAAKTSAQRGYTEAYDAAMAKALAALEASEAAAREEYRGAIERYREKLESSRLDEAAFISACESALGEGV
jgi:vacuolar-type H+-ATPase subunit H